MFNFEQLTFECKLFVELKREKKVVKEMEFKVQNKFGILWEVNLFSEKIKYQKIL